MTRSSLVCPARGNITLSGFVMVTSRPATVTTCFGGRLGTASEGRRPGPVEGLLRLAALVRAAVEAPVGGRDVVDGARERIAREGGVEVRVHRPGAVALGRRAVP